MARLWGIAIYAGTALRIAWPAWCGWQRGAGCRMPSKQAYLMPCGEGRLGG